MKSSLNQKQRIFLFGGGLHSLSCIDIIEKQETYELAGIIDSEKEIGSHVDDYKIIGSIEDLPDLMEKYQTKAGFISVGDNWVRKKIYNQILKRCPDFTFVNLFHPSAVLGKHIKMGKGVFLGAQSFISSGCRVDDFVLLHQKAHIGLLNHMEKFSSISVGSLTGGKVTIGEFAAITIGVVVADRVRIGRHSVVGSGSLVVRDVPEYVTAYGNPATIVRERKEGDAYLKSG
jgi:sugar O-acyltransferase (sialic acid O-acetyltransferase NeuD family)